MVPFAVSPFLPMKAHHGFGLHKGDFKDATALR